MSEDKRTRDELLAEVVVLTGKLDDLAADPGDADRLRGLARACAHSARLRAAGKCDLCEAPAPCGCSYGRGALPLGSGR